MPSTTPAISRNPASHPGNADGSGNFTLKELSRFWQVQALDPPVGARDCECIRIQLRQLSDASVSGRDLALPSRWMAAISSPSNDRHAPTTPCV